MHNQQVATSAVLLILSGKSWEALAGGQHILLPSQGHRALEGESEDRSCNGSKFLLSLVVGLGCRKGLGAASANGPLQPLSCRLCLLAGLQPTHNPQVSHSTMAILLTVCILPLGREWQEVPSAWMCLGLLLLRTFAWRAGKISQPCQTMWGNWLLQVPFPPKTVAWPCFLGNVAETPISRKGFFR